MKESLLELDPQADALLILQKPNLHSPPELLNEFAPISSTVCHHFNSPIPFCSETEEDEMDEMRWLDPYLENGDPNQVVFRVSAKHLCLASPVFRRMIQGKFKESEPNEQGLLEIRAPEWNAEAFLIVLDIIHGHHSCVPTQPSLQVVAQVGVIVDYYDCLEVVRIFFQGWHLSMKIWDKYSTRLSEEDGIMGIKPFGHEATTALFMAWVVRDQVRFTALTISAVLSTNALIETTLPIPAQILEAINNQRCAVIDDIISQIYNLKDYVVSGFVGCNVECSLRLLEVLFRQMNKLNLPMLRPERPLWWYTVISLVTNMGPSGTSVSSRKCHCTLQSHLNIPRNKEDLNIAVPGLNLKDFQ
ncbi:uncharacterized protein FSUBG_12634 [Fusarium subglutinans]|uniref:BTB domain-containing protein n=1 Tax=Gibberella subglutinans TaxID=42677 RepID=A0A8H5L201_GIBSU|nr:uncharacterized protein FSUBG_12634 [Fusarium subglutinans]KAF5584880.1 hypothetical protein FSUBG_12634 [Fusarium subglutinans]